MLNNIRNKACLYVYVVTYKNCSNYFFDLSESKEEDLSYHSEQRMIKNMKNLIFGKFSKIVKNTPALSLWVYIYNSDARLIFL